jgi:hypothetical protein
MSIELGISIISLLIAFLAYCKSKEAIRISMGESERSTRDLISQARRNMEDRALYFAELLKDIKNKKEPIFKASEKAVNSAVEDWLNAYENACGKYLDGKIDKKRFRKDFETEIRNLMEEKKKNKIYGKLLYPKEKSHYKNIWKVYNMWKLKK